MVIRSMAAKTPNKNLPFAKYLRYSHWKCIAQDPWVLNASASLRINFLHATIEPDELTFSEEETESLQSGIIDMLNKQVISMATLSNVNRLLLLTVSGAPKDGN